MQRHVSASGWEEVGTSCWRERVKKIVQFTTRNSVIHDFRACSNENCSIYDTEISYTQFSGALLRNSLLTSFLVYMALSGT